MRLICLCCKMTIWICVESEIVHITFVCVSVCSYCCCGAVVELDRSGDIAIYIYNECLSLSWISMANLNEYKYLINEPPWIAIYNNKKNNKKTVLQHHQQKDTHVWKWSIFTIDYAYFAHISVSLKTFLLNEIWYALLIYTINS